MRKWIVLLLAALLALPSFAMAAPSLEEIQEELEEIQDRLDYAEKHSATDRLSFSGDMRVKGDTLHWQDATWNPAITVNFQDFFEKLMPAAAAPGATGPLGGFNLFDPMNPQNGLYAGTGALGTDDASPLDQMFYGLYMNNPQMYQGLMSNFQSWMMATMMAPPGAVDAGTGAFPLLPGSVPGMAPKTSDIDNDIAYTTRLRLNMKAKVYKNVNFAGRLSMYKNWGDSTGTKVFDSWDAFTMDGTDGGNTTGDWLRVERAYFNWKNIGDTPFYLSIGRRPSTYGPPSQYRENEMRGGTPSGHLVHFNFDGITLGYGLSDVLEGMAVRFCYGQGYESQVGNGEMYNNIATEDTQLGGLNMDVINDCTNFVQLTAFAALDVVDGFKGTFAFPTELGAIFAPTLYHDMQKFPTFNFVTRYQPSTVIGDMYLGGLGLAREEDNGINYFASLGWTRLESNGKAGMFGGMGNDAVFEAGLNSFGDEIVFSPVSATDDETNDGYGVYVGTQLPVMDGVKLGLEYNYGSKYWTPFTQAQDDMLGSKLATRGHVGEVYSIFEVNPRTFIKLAGLYYDYEYTGSGSPVGAPQNVDEVLAGDAFSFLPVADTAWNANASLTIRF